MKIYNLPISILGTEFQFSIFGETLSPCTFTFEHPSSATPKVLFSIQNAIIKNKTNHQIFASKAQHAIVGRSL